jgi:hypothetical protein
MYKRNEGEVLRLVINTPFDTARNISLEPKAQWSLWKVKENACKVLELDPKGVLLTLDGNVLDDEFSVMDLPLRDNLEMAIIPGEIRSGVDEQALIEEFRYIQKQFPLVKMEDLLTYKGRLRCERGYVKELADKGIWPFVEYVKWHEFKMVLSYLHPYKPPTVTWLTDISHPNIIPKKKGKVCVNILGKKWLPNTKLAAVINALYFLLSDPNPYSAYPNRRCKEVAKIVRMYGFPIKRRMAPEVQGGP